MESSNRRRGGGAFKLTKESLEKDTAVPIWQESTLPKLLCNVSQKMKKLLALFDVKEEDQSPFFSFHGDIKNKILDWFASSLSASFLCGDKDKQTEENPDDDNKADKDVLANTKNTAEWHAVPCQNNQGDIRSFQGR